MKAVDFDYERPPTLSGALALLAQDGVDVAVLAGGQSLAPMMNFRMARPDLVVDLGGIEELRGIEVGRDAVRIGAMTRYVEFQRRPDLAALLPLVARALPHVAHRAIRNRGTFGGSAALADPAAEMPAVMLALGACVVAVGPEGERRIPAGDFFLGSYETALGPQELVLAVEFPAAGDGDRFGFHEIARRHGDYAMAGCALALGGDRPSIALFSVADGPVRAGAAEAALAGDPEAVEAAVETLGEIDFAGDLNASRAMKRHLAGVVLRRAWSEVCS